MPLAGRIAPAQSVGMKKYIREMLDDLRKEHEAKTVKLDAPPAPALPEDLENQELSADPVERVRQLDQQAQDAEVRETLEP